MLDSSKGTRAQRAQGCRSLGGRLPLKLAGREEVKDAGSESLLFVNVFPVQSQPLPKPRQRSPALPETSCCPHPTVCWAVPLIACLFSFWYLTTFLGFLFSCLRHQFPKYWELKETRGCCGTHRAPAWFCSAPFSQLLPHGVEVTPPAHTRTGYCASVSPN